MNVLDAETMKSISALSRKDTQSGHAQRALLAGGRSGISNSLLALSPA
jgi:hypothetical protein